MCLPVAGNEGLGRGENSANNIVANADFFVAKVVCIIRIVRVVRVRRRGFSYLHSIVGAKDCAEDCMENGILMAFFA